MVILVNNREGADLGASRLKAEWQSGSAGILVKDLAGSAVKVGERCVLDGCFLI